jgi:hypothetical protein
MRKFSVYHAKYAFLKESFRILHSNGAIARSFPYNITISVLCRLAYSVMNPSPLICSKFSRCATVRWTLSRLHLLMIDVLSWAYLLPYFSWNSPVGCVSVSVTHEFWTLDKVRYISLTHPTRSAIALLPYFSCVSPVGCVSVSVTHEFWTLDKVRYISLTHPTRSATRSAIALQDRRSH